VSGKNKTTFNEMIRFDILYAEKKSLWLDSEIILKTFPVVLFQLKDIVVRKLKGRPRNPTVPVRGLTRFEYPNPSAASQLFHHANS